jgi:hypothetical protein
MAASPTDVSTVLGPDYKKPFTLIVAIAAVLVTLLFAISGIEKFVDGRVELKLADQRRRQDEQGERIKRIEEQFSTMRETLAEIRADVRVLRSRTEQSDK